MISSCASRTGTAVILRTTYCYLILVRYCLYFLFFYGGTYDSYREQMSLELLRSCMQEKKLPQAITYFLFYFLFIFFMELSVLRCILARAGGVL